MIMSASETGVTSVPKADVEPELLAAKDIDSEIVEERRGLRGAAVIAAIAVGLVFLGWLAFYFELYLRRANGG
jgi:hypothetical protein